MPTVRLAEQEFVAHVYAPVEGPHAEVARQQLDLIWQRCREQFAMTEQIRGVPAVDLPADWPGVGPFAVLAAQQDLGADFQAILRREHDVLNLSIVFASPIGPERSLRLGSAAPPGWTDFTRWWQVLTAGGTDAFLGVALIFQAKAPTAQPDPEALAEHVRTALVPEPEDAPAWWMSGGRTPGGFAMWECSRADHRPQRRLVVLAGPDQDAALSDFTWSDGSTALPPLGRYLMHAAKLRYQSRVRGDGTALRELESEVNEILDRCTTRAAQPEELDEPELRLAGTLAALGTLRHTAEISVANMRASQSPVLRSDELVGEALLRWLPDDIAYLDLVFKRVGVVRRVLGERPAPAEAGPSVLTMPAPAVVEIPDRLDLAMCFGVDIVDYSSRSGPAKSLAQKRLADVLRRALQRLGLNLDDLIKQPTGDGLNVVLPQSAQLHHALPGVLDALRQELAADNRNQADRLRLRLSISVGMIGSGETGFTGELIIEVDRLLNSSVLRDASHRAYEVDLVAIVSNTLHRFVIKPEWAIMPSGRLDRFMVTVKEYNEPGWLWVPEAAPQ